jgi:hypothetical protein
MLSLRITAPDGSLRVLPLHGPELSVGRAPGNGLVLDGDGVSSYHCALVVEDDRCTVQDRGSTNGTFVNNAPIQQPVLLGEHDRVYVGQYLLQLIDSRAAAHPTTAPHLAAAAVPARAGGARARILIQREDRSWRDEHKRLARHAEQWEQWRRADRLALRSHELRRAQKWLSVATPEQQDEVTPLQRELIEASAGANQRSAAKRGLGIAGAVLALGGLVTTAVLLWPEDDGHELAPEPTDTEPTDTDDGVGTEPTDIDDGGGTEPKAPDEDRVAIREQIDHEVVPEESLEDIARRYGVTVADIAEWNLLDTDQAILPPGKVVTIKRPTKRPLAQQRIKYELEPEDVSWTALSERFGVSAKKLRAYNPDVERLRKGQEIVIWIDPHPYEPKEPRTPIGSYVVTMSALSMGHPNAGSLVNGIQLPESPLYIRRYKNIMWGSGYLIANVQKAVAQFRQDMDFDGTLVLADISKKNGGRFSPPHGSHQSGRDIDIWLPTLRGVFKEKYLTEDGEEKFGRRPNPEEVDWFAAWGLIRALIGTGAVQQIFLTYSIQPSVYDAAKLLGASDEELDMAIQWPRKYKKGIVIHEDGHTHHMHVRFKCAPHEKACKPYPTHDKPEL